MERELKDILIAHGVYGEENLDEAVEKILLLLGVVGRSEQYHCETYDFGRKDKPCDKQCDGCKAMNLD